MLTIDITLDNELLAELSKFANLSFSKDSLPETYNAFKYASIDIQRQWQGWALGGSIDGIEDIKNPNSKLAQSIKTRENSPFDFDIYSNSEYMKRIQEGSPEFDMKKTHPFGNKSRMGKTGPYLVIPFNWSTPKAGAHGQTRMSPKIYKSVGALAKSKVTGNTHIELNAKGIPIERNEYNWGDRFESDIETRLDDYAQGMVSFNTSTDKSTSSTYFTFRVISVNSPANSWIRKEIKPIDVASALVQNNQNTIIQNIENAVKSDLGI